MKLLKVTSLVVIGLLIGGFILTSCSTNDDTVSITMNNMVIEEKNYIIEPGEYMEMWIETYNQDEDEEYREHYKVMIEDSNIYNLLEEGETYFARLDGSRNSTDEAYVYTISQIAKPDGDQLRGEGRVH